MRSASRFRFILNSRWKDGSQVPESFGQLQSIDGTKQEITALFTIFRDEREVSVMQTDKGTIVVNTKSWLRDNNRKLVEITNVYTLETFIMMLEAMTLGAEYFGIDVMKQVEKLHASEGGIRFEYAGRGEPDFSRFGEPKAECKEGETGRDSCHES